MNPLPFFGKVDLFILSNAPHSVGRVFVIFFIFSVILLKYLVIPFKLSIYFATENMKILLNFSG